MLFWPEEKPSTTLIHTWQITALPPTALHSTHLFGLTPPSISEKHRRKQKLKLKGKKKRSLLPLLHSMVAELMCEIQGWGNSGKQSSYPAKLFLNTSTLHTHHNLLIQGHLKFTMEPLLWAFLSRFFSAPGSMKMRCQMQVLHRAAPTTCTQRLLKAAELSWSQQVLLTQVKKSSLSFGICCHTDIQSAFSKQCYLVSTSQEKSSSYWADSLLLLDFSFELSGNSGKGSSVRHKEGGLYTWCCQLP